MLVISFFVDLFSELYWFGEVERLQKQRVSKTCLPPPPTPSNLLLTVPRRYFYCGSSMLHVMSVCIWSSALSSSLFFIIFHTVYVFLTVSPLVCPQTSHKLAPFHRPSPESVVWAGTVSLLRTSFLSFTIFSN